MPLGSSPGTATAPRTRSAPSNAALLSAHRPTYPWPPEQRSRLSQQPGALQSSLRIVFADSIYNRLAALLACYLAGLVLVIVRRLAGTTGFVVQPRRWVVEGSFGWFGRWRRLSKDYEALPEVSEAMVT